MVASMIASVVGAARLRERDGLAAGGSTNLAVDMPATARSMLRRAGAKLSTTSVTASPIFMNSRALRGAGSAIRRRGT